MKSPRLPSWNVAPNPDKHYLLRHILPMDEEHANVSDVFFQRRWSVLRSVDDMIERFIDLLTKADVMDETYIVFSSDHGYHLGEFGMLYDKRMLYETDIRVPLFVSGPGIKPGQTIESPVGHIDLAPTILAMAGIASPPPQMDGRSWLPLVFGGAEAQTQAATGWRKTFMVEYSGGGHPEDVEASDFVTVEASYEDKHWFHSFVHDVVSPTLKSPESGVYRKYLFLRTFIKGIPFIPLFINGGTVRSRTTVSSRSNCTTNLPFMIDRPCLTECV